MICPTLGGVPKSSADNLRLTCDAPGMTGKYLSRILPLALLATILIGAPSPARAESPYTFTGPTGVLYSACNDYAFTYSTPPTYEVTWQLEVTDPDGLHSSSIFEIDPAGTDTLYMCGGVDKVGTYNIKGTLQRCSGSSGFSCDTTIVASSFTLTAPGTQTKLKATPTKVKYNGTVKLKAQTFDQVPAGFAASESYPKVIFEAKVQGGGWKRLKHGVVSCDENGVAVAKYLWNLRGTTSVRAVRQASSEGATSASSVVKIKTQ